MLQEVVDYSNMLLHLSMSKSYHIFVPAMKGHGYFCLLMLRKGRCDVGINDVDIVDERVCNYEVKAEVCYVVNQADEVETAL